MTDEERIIFKNHLKNYPYFYPCIKCKYWRTLNGSRAVSIYTRYNESMSQIPACHYFIETGKLRNELPLDGSCSCFVERE